MTQTFGVLVEDSVKGPNDSFPWNSSILVYRQPEKGFPFAGGEYPQDARHS